jgi:hypothetical protein
MSESDANTQHAQSLTLFSEGTRIAADLFIPTDAQPGTRLPAILLWHG